ncbi:MAG: hypothetical protein OXH00_01985 [Candidatus Poribacteria bacterium]|nr:hypothetical protein [Candidatus Poribacteria bacterium]
MNFGIFLGVMACVLLVWYLYRRSKNGTPEDTEHQSDDTDAYEDILLTGVMLSDVYADDDTASDDVDSDGYDSMDDSGGFDDRGFA